MSPHGTFGIYPPTCRLCESLCSILYQHMLVLGHQHLSLVPLRARSGLNSMMGSFCFLDFLETISGSCNSSM
nr:hypothetical protein Q903MT_gene4409 [Picea sitchensis]